MSRYVRSALTPWRRARRGPTRAVAWAIAALVLVLGLGATWLEARDEREAAEALDRERLARVARNRAESVADAVRDDVAILWAAAAFQSVNGLDRAAFLSYTSRLPLASTPGLTEVSFIVPVTPGNVSALEVARRAAGQPGFTVDPGPLDGRYHVVLFSGPSPGTTDGLDVGQVEVLAPALERAADSGLAVLTDPFVPIQDQQLPAEEQHLAVAVYVPVYRAGAATATVAQRRDALLGWTASAIPMHSLLSELGVTGAAEVRLAVRDVDAPSVDLAAIPASEPPERADSAVARFEVLGQRWEVEATTLPSFERADGAAGAVAIAGVLASVAIAALVLNLGLQRRRLALTARASLAQAAATEGRFRAIVDNAPVGVVVLDFDGAVLDYNREMIRMVGNPTDRVFNLVEVSLAEDLPVWQEDLARFRAGEIEHDLVIERQLRRIDGSTFWARTTSAPLPGERALVAIVEDVTVERAAAEAAEELRSRRARFEALVRHSTDLITVLDANHRILYASPAIAALVGVTPEQAVGTAVVETVHPDDRSAVRASLDVAARTPGVTGPLRYRIVASDGSERWVEATATNLLDDPDVNGIVTNCRDVTAQHEADEALRQRVFTDALTGLATRDLLLERLDAALAEVQDRPGTVAALFVDLDRFKQVNDRYGHAAGDALLIEVSRLISEAVRPGDMVARHGGDEFVVLLKDVRGEREARAVAERVRAALRRPIVVGDGVLLEPGASVGVALSDGSTTAEAMVRNADAALYRAKASGRDRVEVFDEELRRRASRRHETEAALRTMLDADSLELRFEPVADLADEAGPRIVGAEARVRVVLASGEVVPYAELLPVAQEAGLASELLMHALEAACAAVRSWASAPSGPRWVGVDVSAGEVTHPTFIERLAGVVAATGLDAGALRLELPVDVVSQGSTLTRRAIVAAQALGVHVVLDGVGAELRGLAALGGFEVDGLKLDLAALPDTVGDPVAAAVAASVGEVAAAAGLPVVVVGADEDAQLEVVRRLGFRYVQGRAVAPVAEAIELLTR